MKNQYFGDVNDYFKYGMLRAFAREMSVAVIWMMTPAHDLASTAIRYPIQLLVQFLIRFATNLRDAGPGQERALVVLHRGAEIADHAEAVPASRSCSSAKGLTFD